MSLGVAVLYLQPFVIARCPQFEERQQIVESLTQPRANCAKSLCNEKLVKWICDLCSEWVKIKKVNIYSYKFHIFQ